MLTPKVSVDEPSPRTKVRSQGIRLPDDDEDETNKTILSPRHDRLVSVTIVKEFATT